MSETSNMAPELSVREIQSSDLDRIADYWLGATPEFLLGMGVALDKMPSRDQWIEMLGQQIRQEYRFKQSYCIIWEINGQAVGHSNVNKIIFAESAYMHLHLWKPEDRMKGCGRQLVLLTLPWFFDNLLLQKLYCEPYALNKAPNKTLEKVGFQLIKSHVTTPGWLNFEQLVNLWELDAARFAAMRE